MDLNLKGRTALVCGSSRGIGLAIAHELALAGANITLVARNKAKLEEVATSLPKNKGQHHQFLVADFKEPFKLQEVVRDYLKGINQLDILINNTGGPPAGKIMDASADDFVAAFQQHIICNQILVQLVAPYMKQHQYGRIINIISTSVKMPIPGLGVSNTIRGAVASWSKTLSMELAPFGITVNNVLPGPTQTARLDNIIQNKVEKSKKTLEEVRQEMINEIPAGHFGKPQDPASAVAFLASPAAAYINGINLTVDGGKTACL